MNKLLQKAEKMLGVDLDGDGHVGKPKPSAGRGGYGGGGAQPQYGQPQYGGQQQYGQQPQYGGAPQQHQQHHQYVAPIPAQMPAPGGGQTKALLIGINYYGQKGQLSGCVNDVKTMQKLLRHLGMANRPGYQEVVLADDRSFPGAKYPTKQEMLTAFRWLASHNRPGDTLFLHYSGHGGQQRDLDGDEADGYDETLIPVDFQRAGQITDDVVFRELVAPLPKGCRMTAVMDCCHSGTAMDLPYVFRASQKSMADALANPAQLAMVISNKKAAMKLGAELLQGFFGGGGKAGSKADSKKPVQADVIMFSGCSDSQTSADVMDVSKFGLPTGSGPGGAGGACTNAMASVLMKNSQLRVVDLLEQMRQELSRRKYSQVPQLTSSQPVDLSSMFSLFGPINQARVQPVQAPPSYWGQYAQGPQAGYFGAQQPAQGYNMHHQQQQQHPGQQYQQQGTAPPNPYGQPQGGPPPSQGGMANVSNPYA